MFNRIHHFVTDVCGSIQVYVINYSANDLNLYMKHIKNGNI
jgi:hypothetical protein